MIHFLKYCGYPSSHFPHFHPDRVTDVNIWNIHLLLQVSLLSVPHPTNRPSVLFSARHVRNHQYHVYCKQHVRAFLFLEKDARQMKPIKMRMGPSNQRARAPGAMLILD